MSISALQKVRSAYQPKLPKSLRGGAIQVVVGDKTQSVANQAEIQQLFPNTYGMPVLSFEQGGSPKSLPVANVGVILSGGQAPGGHNVISGLYDGLKALNKGNKLYGFLGGPGGLVDHQYVELTAAIVDEYRNTGGFDIIGSGRTKLEETEQYDKGVAICKKLGIKALIVIGGDDSNTNACVLAEYYVQKQTGIQVIGCPKTIDGDLKNDWIETSFGFDTACKVYSELIGNIQRDANSAKKYWHFIKLMGRSASHIGLECMLQCHANICIISEEVEAKKQTLDEIINGIADVVAKRAANNENFGVILIPEGLIEFIPAMKILIQELNDLLAHSTEFAKLDEQAQHKYVVSKLSGDSSKVFACRLV
jgi:pyrophosphate--fructose-6-phosphate 1-phosphotransferase